MCAAAGWMPANQEHSSYEVSPTHVFAPHAWQWAVAGGRMRSKGKEQARVAAPFMELL